MRELNKILKRGLQTTATVYWAYRGYWTTQKQNQQQRH